MRRAFAFLKLIVVILVVGAAVTFAASRVDKPHPPANDLAMLGLKGPIHQFTLALNGTTVAHYEFDENGDLTDWNLMTNGEPVSMRDENGESLTPILMPEVPVEDREHIEFFQRGVITENDPYGNWISRHASLIRRGPSQQGIPGAPFSWKETRSFTYYGAESEFSRNLSAYYDQLLSQALMREYEQQVRSGAPRDFLPMP
ncbi:MAG: hypothetical protein GC154_13965 [bacterium]|nr:hypothetical protein [bacterium]